MNAVGSTMLERLNPPTVPKPASAYSQAVRHDAAARRLVVSGQIGVSADKVLAEGLAAQIDQAFTNLVAVVRAAGLGPEHVVKIVAYMVAPGDVALYRAARDRALEGHEPASTYVVVAGLADPRFLFEVEGEAIGP